MLWVRTLTEHFLPSFHLRHRSEAGYIVIHISQVRGHDTPVKGCVYVELRFAPQALIPCGVVGFEASPSPPAESMLQTTMS